MTDISEGAKVLVKGRDVGVIRYGPATTEFASGEWVGVELEAAAGEGNGTVAGVQYFSCPDGHATFVEKTFLAADCLPRFHGERRLHYYDCGLVSVGHRIELVTARSHRPFHQSILDQEALLVVQCRLELSRLQVPPRAIRQTRGLSLTAVRNSKEPAGL